MTGKKLKIEYVPATALKPNPKNPRKNDAAVGRLVNSIEAFGWTSPILASRDNTIIAGHTRLKAAKEKGIKEVPVIYLDLDPSDAEVYMVADNRLTEIAEWDNDLLSDLMVDFKALGKELELTGFDPDKIAELTGDIDGVGLPDLPDGDKPEFQQMTFTLHDTQAEQVKAAMDVSKAMGAFVDSPNENSNGNALARICEIFVTQNGNG